MDDRTHWLWALIALISFGLGAWGGWATQRHELHEEAVAVGHAEYRYVHPPTAGISYTEFVWLPACREEVR